jgi:hypothetical protein
MSNIELRDEFELQQEVVSRYIKGLDPVKIGKELGLKTPQVNTILKVWRQTAINDVEVRERAREALAGMDESYSMVLKELWATVEETNLNGDLRTKNSVLKNIADVEAKRVDTLQKAGLLDDQRIGNQLAEAEERFEQIKKLLVDTVYKCHDCKVPVAQGLARIFNEGVPIKVDAQRPEDV